MMKIEEAQGMIAAVASNIGLRVRIFRDNNDIVIESTQPHKNTTVVRVSLDQHTGDWMVVTEWNEEPGLPRVDVPRVNDAMLVGAALSEWVKKTARVLVTEQL